MRTLIRLLAIVAVSGCAGEIENRQAFGARDMPEASVSTVAMPGLPVGTVLPADLARDGQVRVTIVPHPALDSTVILGACDAWWWTGRECVQEVPLWANVTVKVYDGSEDPAPDFDHSLVECQPHQGDTPGVTLMRTLSSGEIQVFSKCFEIRTSDGTFDRYDTFGLRATFAHEFGHVNGLPHVDHDCAGTLDGLGNPVICGRATMNPYVDTLNSPEPTEIDGRLWDAVHLGTSRAPIIAVK